MIENRGKISISTQTDTTGQQSFPFVCKEILSTLACPVCKCPLRVFNITCFCTNHDCQTTFPIVEGIPVLLNEKRSVFRIRDYTISQSAKSYDPRQLVRFIRSIVPSLTRNWVATRNYKQLAQLLRARPEPRIVLIVGGGELGEGLESLLDTSTTKVLETDVYFGSRTRLVADAHDLPFLDASFDAVIVQAVLEHVLDPYRCVTEIHRVLKNEGLVYAESPFMYPVHMGAYDFTRFSLSAHRRLFNNFTEIDGGIAGGPGQVLALSIKSLFLSFSTALMVEAFATIVLPFFIFWLKYCDYFLHEKPHAADFASSFYFLGQRAEQPVSDVDIINRHWSRRRSINN